MRKFAFLLFCLILFVSCEEDINVYLKKQPGWLSGKVLPALADVSVELYQGELIQQTTTNASGIFTFRDVKPGIYRIIIKAESYGTTELTGIGVEDGEGQDLGDIELSRLPAPISSMSPRDGQEEVSCDPHNRTRIRFYFYKEMDFQSVENAFSITPEPENGFEFAYAYKTTTNINCYSMFTFDGKFSTNYIVKLDTTARTIDGVPLEFPLISHFRTEDFEVVDLHESERRYGKYPVYVRFNSSVNRNDIFNYLTIIPECEVNISSYSNTNHVIQPVLSWHPDTSMMITLSQGLPEIGGATLQKDYQLRFNTEPLAVIYHDPYDYQHFVRQTSTVFIKFNYLIDESSVTEALSIDPLTELILRTDDGDGSSSIYFTAVNGLQKATKYTVTVDMSLKHIYGSYLKEPYSFSFTTIE